MPIDKETTSKTSPQAEIVNDFHRYSDLDSKYESQHHSLGNRSTQAARGDHLHRTGENNGLPILDGVVLSGSRSANTVAILGQICDALALIGASNNTVA